ncbi:peptidase [Chelonobacter oris]|uniref:Peptidase n=1 Tax=Chelonobacter oris TaxID=505317 RepID=A0A0A3AW79_9PAST|nr:M20 family metallopeptidase [Chelonobacter oris]KGQ71360.1 peptidase [Chelonobacter oris]
MSIVDLKTFVNDLETIVNIESYSCDPKGKADVVEFLREKFQALNWHIEVFPLDDSVGSALVCMNRKADRFDVLLSGHMDTVFKPGTTNERPFSKDQHRAYGPGVCDMKQGLIQAYHVCKKLTENNEIGDGNICVIFNPDEEISSVYSRPLLEKFAAKARYAIVLEAARANGDLVNARRGVARYVIEFFGKEAHAAVNPEAGANAVNACIYTCQTLLNQVAPEKGTTLNIGTIEGGTTPNTVPAYVKIQVDCRFILPEEAERLNSFIQALDDKITEENVRISVQGGVTRPPWAKTEDGLIFCQAVDQIKRRLEIKADWVSTGGGSDGNFFAALGIPTIDGMGLVGGKYHSPEEYLELDSIIPRTALLYETVKFCLSHHEET